MGGCSWPEHTALCTLTSASTGDEGLGKRCLDKTGICSQQYRYGSKSQFAINDNLGAGSRSTIRHLKSVTLLDKNVEL